MESSNYFDRLASTAGQKSDIEEYWINTFSKDLVKTGFPFDEIPINKKGETNLIREFTFQFATDVYQSLIKLSNGSYPRLHMILITSLISLLFKYTGNFDIVLGTSIYKQEIEGEFINTVLPLRLLLHENFTFKELLLQVREVLSEAVENQNYPIELLLQKIGMPLSRTDDFPLFDIILLLENIQDKKYVSQINTNMLFLFLDTGEALNGILSYNSLVFSLEKIKQIYSHFTQLIKMVLLNIDYPLTKIDILTDEEKKKILVDFNLTEKKYSDDKNIIELFQEQVEKKPEHIAVVQKQNYYSYSQLEEESTLLAKHLTNKGATSEILVGLISKPSWEFIIGVIGILKTGAAYLPIDEESPETRIQFIIQDSNTKILITGEKQFDQTIIPNWEGEQFTIKKIIQSTKEEILLSAEKYTPPTISNVSLNTIAYLIYTSGTTGKPKGVSIDHLGFVNYLRWAASQYLKESETSFPLFTSISFDLTITSIFSPLITGNTVVVYKDTNEDNITVIHQIINDNKVEAIKLTPSHLRLIRGKHWNSSKLKCLIVGGEELDCSLAREISQNFKNKIKIYNEYGPTETVVGCTYYLFNQEIDLGKSVPIGIPINNTKVYILDFSQSPVPFGVAGELYIAGDGVSRGYLNNPELTSEKFKYIPEINGLSHFLIEERRALNRNLDSPTGSNTHWRIKAYRTGDLASWLNDGNIQFKGRIDQQIKIRGFRIEPAEIEYRLMERKDIKNVIVVAHEQSSGDNYLTAYIVPREKKSNPESSLQAVELRQQLSNVLPNYMIPTFFVFLSQFPLTSNGKINRKALPQPKASPDSHVSYYPPRTWIERELVKIWSEILKIEKQQICIDSNFFHIGGHSLKATELISEIHKQLNLHITLKEVFLMPSIRQLSEFLYTLDRDILIPIAPAIEKKYYSLSFAQKRIYVAQQLEPESTSYNTGIIVNLIGTIDKTKIKKALEELIQRHECLRTSFRMKEKKPVQEIHEIVDFNVEYIDFTSEGLHSVSQEPNNIESLVEKFRYPFDLSQAPLLRVGIVKIEPDKHILMLDMHHIISDGVSFGIFIRDFAALYHGQQLPSLNIRYVDFSEWQNQLFSSSKLKKQESYWLTEFKEKPQLMNLPTDYPRPSLRSNEKGDSVFTNMKEDLSLKLKKTAQKNGTTLFMVLLTIFKILMSKYGRAEDIVVGTTVPGRTHLDLKDVIGVFINMLALRSIVDKNKPFKEFLMEVKNKTIAAFDNQDYPFDQLINKLGIERKTGRNPLFDAEFSMNIPEVEAINIPGLKIEPYKKEIRFAKYDLHLLIIDHNTNIQMRLRYSTELFKRSTVEKILDYYIEIAKQVVDQEEILIRNIKISHTFTSTTSSFGKESESDFIL